MVFFYFYFLPLEEHFCLILQLCRFDFQWEFNDIHAFNFINMGFKFKVGGANSFDT